jgi:hypothetical protein
LGTAVKQIVNFRTQQTRFHEGATKLMLVVLLVVVLAPSFLDLCSIVP